MRVHESSGGCTHTHAHTKHTHPFIRAQEEAHGMGILGQIEKLKLHDTRKLFKSSISIVHEDEEPPLTRSRACVRVCGSEPF
jgi:hypothetical protein